MSIKASGIPFVKASACGNDFLLIDFPRVAQALESFDIAEVTQQICDRHDGVGADGVEWMHPHATADVEVRLVNADGSEAEISGNGTRCVAAYLCKERLLDKVTIQTGAGLKTCVLTERNDPEYEFEVDMGKAVVSAELPVLVGGIEVRGLPVSMGNPHYVIFVRDFPGNWQVQAEKVQRSTEFKNGVNVEMVAVDGKHDLRVRFFERGVGETRSSGTGSCASAVAAMAAAGAESPVRVHASGGIQTVRMQEGRIFLRGSARLVCRGEWFAGFKKSSH